MLISVDTSNTDTNCVVFDTILPQQIRRANFIIIGTADYQHSLVDTNDSCIHCVEGKCVIV